MAMSRAGWAASAEAELADLERMWHLTVHIAATRERLIPDLVTAAGRARVRR